MQIKALALTLLIAVVHAVVTLALSVYAFNAAMERLDGHPSPSGWQGTVQRGAGDVAQVLVMPGDLVYQALPSRQKPSGVEWVVFALNSLLWGALAVWLWRRLRSVQSRPADDAA